MLSNIRPKETDELYATPILQQTAFWSEVKASLGAETMAVNFAAQSEGLYGAADEKQLIHSDLLIILRQIDAIIQ